MNETATVFECLYESYIRSLSNDCETYLVPEGIKRFRGHVVIYNEVKEASTFFNYECCHNHGKTFVRESSVEHVMWILRIDGEN